MLEKYFIEDGNGINLKVTEGTADYMIAED
jgi:hypothetical protein